VYGSPTPIVPSHEPVGTIVAVGSDVKQWQVGQRVGVLLFRHACKICVGCENTGDIRYCSGKDMAGLTANGGMAEYILGDVDGLVLLPDSVPFEQAAPLMCAGVSLLD
jgi:D-arabinose 1-dehydrogenase-like Zn-dependent alcohol dehydrogenase